MASTQSSSTFSQGSSFSGINDPKALEALQTLIQTLQSGGTEGMKSQASAKKAGIEQINTALGSYSKSAAFQDALDLVGASLDKAMLAQKPAITRAVQGAGTSASAMQGLLATNAAESASLQAGALGADQAKSYGQITSSLLNTLMSATSSSDPAVTELLKALDLSRVQTQQNTSSSQSVGTSTDGGQGGSAGGGGIAHGSGGSSGSSSSAKGLFDEYNPYNYSSQQDTAYRQYQLDGSGVPVPTDTSANGKTITYGTDPNSPGYMQISNTTDNSYIDSASSVYKDPYAGNYGYDNAYADYNFSG